jgi:hypothetical protein
VVPKLSANGARRRALVDQVERTQRAAETLSAEAKVTEAAAAAAISRHQDLAYEAREVWFWEAIKRQKFDRNVALIMEVYAWAMVRYRLPSVAAPWSSWCAGPARGGNLRRI